MGGSGLDRTEHFRKFCGSGLTRIQFFRNRTGLELKNFSLLVSAVHHHSIPSSVVTAVFFTRSGGFSVLSGVLFFFENLGFFILVKV